ncbi:MAG TPA: UPF0182 family protein [Mycobacteriales bacterium]|nr:UPF0182 family protein [Mycobacteriales bacterium]
MSFRVRTGGTPRLPVRPRRLLPILIGIVLVILAVAAFVHLETDLLWYRSVHYSNVFNRRLTTEIVLFVVFGVLMALVVGVNIYLAYRFRPTYRPISQEQQQLEALSNAFAHVRRWVFGIVLLAIGLFTGAAAAGRWSTWLEWRNGVSFGIEDPQFHRDVSYYAFTYPMQRFLLGMGFTAVFLSLVAVLVVAYLYGALRLQTPGPKVTPAARAHISVLLGFFVLLKAFAYYLDRFGLNYSTRGFVDTGASYTDVHAVLPAKTILVFVALICAVLFFLNLRTRNWRLPAIAFGLMVASAVVIGGIYPLLVQQFSVRPSEADKEAPYIARNITETRLAYGLVPGQNVQQTAYAGTPDEDGKAVRADQSTLPNIRLLDPNAVPATFQQLQGFKGFYAFPDSLDVDRYDVNGAEQEQVVGIRDLNLGGLNAQQQSWINRHLVYTHGYGFVAAAGNAVDADGTPKFVESDIPPKGALGTDFEPRVYFGETSPAFSVVGAPRGAPERELDYPSDSGNGQVNTTYRGNGGVPIGSFWRRALYSLHFGDKNLLFSSGVNDSSRLLYIRDPSDRVRKVAPFLKLDGDPYPAIVNGRILWIVDGYTTTNGFPYAARTSLSTATEDTATQQASNIRTVRGQVNYIRNSVKATVDAYDGTVTLYQWGPRDAVLETWKKAFPGIIKPESAMSPELRAHLRYPEDLFKVQRTLLAKYHITDPRSFYAGTDYWKVPDDPTKTEPIQQPPYYLTLAMPGQTSPSFQLTSALAQNNRKNMAAFVSVQSDPSSSEYGKISVLQLPSNTQVSGPEQVGNDFESYAPAAANLSLLRKGGSRVDLGNLLTLPLGGSFLYVEPVYIRSAGTTSFPTLKKVLVSWNGTISYESTLGEALDTVFGAAATPPPAKGSGGGGGQGGGAQGGGGHGGAKLSARVQALIAQLQAAQAHAEAALRSGDLSAYARAEQRVAAVIKRLARAAA